MEEEQNPSETLKLNPNPPPNQPRKQPPLSLAALLLLQSIQWLQMLCKQLNPTFILGIALVYDLSQGFSNSFFKVVIDFYWKDVQKVQPSVSQIYIGFYYIPWILKPVWGLLTYVFPVMGYHQRPYFVATGVVGVVLAAVVELSSSSSSSSSSSRVRA